MTRLTRRGALGLGIAGLGAAACATTEGGAYRGKAQFAHGVASGDPAQTSLLIWTRVTPEAPGPVPVKWSLSRDAGFKDVVQRGTFTTGPERDYTVKARAREDLLLLVHGRSGLLARRGDADAAGKRTG